MTRQILVPGGEGRAFAVRRGQTIRIVDLEGQQVCDFVCFNQHLPAERLSTGETMNLNMAGINLAPGTRFYSNLQNPMFEIVEDTSPGIHDLLYAPCSSAFYLQYIGDPAHPNCRDNLAEAIQPFGLRYIDVPDPVNLFQYTRPRADGSIDIRPAASGPGDHITLRALIDCIVAVSACPCDIPGPEGQSIIGPGATPISVEFL